MSVKESQTDVIGRNRRIEKRLASIPQGCTLKWTQRRLHLPASIDRQVPNLIAILKRESGPCQQHDVVNYSSRRPLFTKCEDTTNMPTRREVSSEMIRHGYLVGSDQDEFMHFDPNKNAVVRRVARRATLFTYPLNVQIAVGGLQQPLPRPAQMNIEKKRAGHRATASCLRTSA